MTHEDPVERERVQTLMMAAVDGEITPEEQQVLDEAIRRSPELEQEWRRFVRLKEVTATMRLQHPPEEIWDRYWMSAYARAERGIAWILVSAGAAVLGGYWLWHMAGALLQETEGPLFIRLAVAAVALGGLILVISVVREKLFTSRRDPYQKEVLR